MKLYIEIKLKLMMIYMSTGNLGDSYIGLLVLKNKD